MQTNKSRRAAEPHHRTSSATTRPNSLSKAAGSDVDSFAGINQPRKISSYKSHKENEHRSHCSNSVLEKRRPSQFTHLESQLGELQEELRRTKDQLSSSESRRKRAQHEAEEAKKQLILMSSKLEDSQQQLIEVSAAEDNRIQELRKISLERDKAWQSELAALQNQQTMDMATWSSAIKERQKLKAEIDILAKSECAMAKQLQATNFELKVLKDEILEKNSAIEMLKIQIAERKSAEEIPNETQKEEQVLKEEILEKNSAIEMLKIQIAGRKGAEEIPNETQKEEQVLKDEILEKNSAIERLKIQIAERKSAEEIHNETQKEEQGNTNQPQLINLESELREAQAEISNLKSKLLNKDADLRNISNMNKKLNDEIRAQVNQVEAEFGSKITQAAINVSELKEKLADKDVELQKLNNLIKIEIEKKEKGGDKSYEAEMEAELRRVKLHSNQWRKAAETAAAILMAESNGRVIERTGLLDSPCFYDGRNLMNSPIVDEIVGADLPKSKNHNVLTMIGGFWKKS